MVEPGTPHTIDWGATLIAAAFGLMAIGVAALTVFLLEGQFAANEQASAGGLAALLLFGVLTFFFALASLVAVFRALGLAEPKSALGMPQGSIRAFMALVLIMLFFLMSVFLYLDVARTGTERRTVGISEATYNQLAAGGDVVQAYSYSVPDPENPDSEIVVWDVVQRTVKERSQVAEEMARQLVTVLGTLIVAISSFYFGTNSVQAAIQPRNGDGDGDGDGDGEPLMVG